MKPLLIPVIGDRKSNSAVRRLWLPIMIIITASTWKSKVISSAVLADRQWFIMLVLETHDRLLAS